MIQGAIARLLDGRHLLATRPAPLWTRSCTAKQHRDLRRHADPAALAASYERARAKPAKPAHALARALDLDAEAILLCLSGRGDKDFAEVLASPERLTRAADQSARCPPRPGPVRKQLAVLARVVSVAVPRALDGAA